MTFNRLDRSTWGDLLTRAEVAQIWQRSEEGIRKAVQLGRFVPLPILTTTGAYASPHRWRKADVVRFLDSGRQPVGISRAS